MCRIQWLCSLLWLSVWLLLAQPIWAAQYALERWTTANGLPQNTVTGVVQTPDGYLWLSTFDGLARFDGVRFTIFNQANTPGIANNRFSILYLAGDGTMWASTESGAITVYQNGRFRSYQTPGEFEVPLRFIRSQDAVPEIHSVQKTFQLQNQQITEIPNPKRSQSKEYFRTRAGSQWELRDSGITRLDGSGARQFNVPFEARYLSYYVRGGIYENSAGGLAFTAKRKLYRIVNDAIHVATSADVPALDKLALHGSFLERDGTESFVFALASDTLVNNAQLVRLKNNRYESYDLGEPLSIRASTVDQEGSVWLATNNGLRRLRRQVVSTLSVANGLSNDEVYSLLQLRNKEVLIGTARGLSRHANGVISRVQHAPLHVPDLHVRGLWQDREEKVWLGFIGLSGVGELRSQESSEAQSAVDKHVLPLGKAENAAGITAFAQGANGDLWMGSEAGLFHFRAEKLIAHYTVADGLRSGKVITLFFDQQQNLWLGTFDGLALFKDGKFSEFSTVKDSPKGYVRAIHQDAEGVLWFGTYGDGLVRYKEGQFFNYRVEHGLYNNGVFAILEDDLGYLWMSSNRGIHRVSKQELDDFSAGKINRVNSISLDEKDGMLSAECNGGRARAAIKTPDGKLWFATMMGVAIVDPTALSMDPVAPAVVIESASIDRQAIAHPAASVPSQIELQPGQSNIAIEYTALSLRNAAQNKFRYRLEGLETNWIEAGTRRSVDYSYLAPGSYTFRVVAANASGVWGMEGARLDIVVRPYFYQTWWFLLSLGLLFGSIVWLLMRFRFDQLRAIAEAKSAFSRQLIDAQEAERKRIAAELHDGLGQNLVVIKNRAGLGLKRNNDPARTEKEFNQISEAASLALIEVREITNNLRPHLLDRVGLTSTLQSLLDKLSGLIEITAVIDSLDQVFQTDETINFYRIVQEALNNIIKHAGAKHINLTIKRSASSVTLEIQDDGRGFDVQHTPSSLGLLGLKERSHLLGGEFYLQSEIGKGTRIRVEIPLV